MIAGQRADTFPKATQTRQHATNTHHTHRENTRHHEHAHEPRSSTKQDYKPTSKKSQPKRPNKRNDRQRVFHSNYLSLKFLKPTNRNQQELPTSSNQSHASPNTTTPTDRGSQVDQLGYLSSPHRFKRRNKDKGEHSLGQHVNNSKRPMNTQIFRPS
jgi:hypothetical protein